MPSKQPRLPLTLSDELSAVLRDLAYETGKPMSKVVTDILQEMLPQLQDLVKLARFAKSGNKEGQRRVLRNMMGDALAEAMDKQHPTGDLFPKVKRAKKHVV